MSKTVYDNVRAAAFCDGGASIREFSEEFGVSYEAARHAISRRGLSKVNDFDVRRDPRRAIQDMKQSDAIEYLLALIDEASRDIDVFPSDISSLKDTLTGSERRIILSLYHAPNMRLSRDALLARLYGAKCWDNPGSPILSVFITKIRKKLPDNIRLKTIWGEGYQLKVGVNS